MRRISKKDKMNRRTKEKRALLFGVEGGQATVMEQRKEFIQEYLTRGKSDFKELCQKYGISEKTGHKFKKRFFEYGYMDLETGAEHRKTARQSWMRLP